ncbi:hypothetical protein GOBAR_AA09018 [Gossypium barbadense]|uniref:Uncharacterized protein n=1 Tax=Gossypium barbadense TaxID=3634 RepID=A0A2P5Y7U7_GOSBA|nr:hypothetical protein GOBAR_AA09018 [Gossypium barbadense]
MTKERTEEQFGKFVKLLKKLHINLPFIEVLSQMPNLAKFLKELLSNKRKLDATSHVELNAVCSTILKNEIPNKLKDPESFIIPCLIGSLSVNNALADLGASDDAVTLQACDSVKTSKTQANAIKPVDDKTNIQSSLQEFPQTKTTETVRYYHEENKDVHEERRLRIEELDEWREHKPRIHDKPKVRRNKPDTSPNQLQVGDTVLLDAVDPHIVTTTPNEEISLMVLSIFPFGTVEERRPWSHPQRDVEDRVLPRCVLQPKFGTRSLTFHKLCRRSYFKYYTHDPSPQVAALTGLRRVVMTNNDDLGTIHFRLGGLVRVMSVPEFGVALGLYTDEFMEEEDMNALICNIHISPSLERTDIINTHDAYYLWCMANAHVTDLAYFIAFAICHQTERHRKGVISIGPYVTRLTRHFGLLNTAAQSSALTLIGQMSPQGFTTMLHMRMIERRRGTDPPQYRLSHAIDVEDLEDIPDDVPL